jgi:hypothetical protein
MLKHSRVASFAVLLPFRRPANHFVNGQLGRRVYMMTSTAKVGSPRPSSFIPGPALRTVIKILQRGESLYQEVLACLDSGADVNLANRHLLHDVRVIAVEDVAK